MTAARERVVDASGDGEDLASLPGRQRRGLQGAASERRLDDQRAAGEPADHPVAARKILAARPAARGKLRYQGAPLTDAIGQPGVLAGIDLVESGAADGHRPASRLQGAFVARRIDSNSQAAGDRESAAGELCCEIERRRAAAGSRIAGADHRNLCLAQDADLSQHEQSGRRPRDLRELLRIVSLPVEDETDTAARHPLQVGLQRRRVGTSQIRPRRAGQFQLLDAVILEQSLQRTRGEQYPQMVDVESGCSREHRAGSSRIHGVQNRLSRALWREGKSGSKQPFCGNYRVRAPRPRSGRGCGLRVADDVVDVQGRLGTDDQRVADSIKRLEDQERAAALVGELDLRVE